MCFLGITGKDALRRTLARKKGNAYFQRAGCLPGSTKGKWTQVSLRLLKFMEKSLGLGKLIYRE